MTLCQIKKKIILLLLVNSGARSPHPKILDVHFMMQVGNLSPREGGNRLQITQQVKSRATMDSGLLSTFLSQGLIHPSMN